MTVELESRQRVIRFGRLGKANGAGRDWTQCRCDISILLFVSIILAVCLSIHSWKYLNVHFCLNIFVTIALNVYHLRGKKNRRKGSVFASTSPSLTSAWKTTFIILVLCGAVSWGICLCDEHSAWYFQMLTSCIRVITKKMIVISSCCQHCWRLKRVIFCIS